MSTTVTWTATSSGDWSNAANWSDDAVPNSNDNVLISTSAVQTITYDTGSTTINELSVGNDHFIMAGGSLEILTTATFNDGFTQVGGTLEAGTIKILKSGTLIGGSATGSTVLNIAGGVALSNYTLAGSAVLNNSNAVISQTGGITVGDNTGVDATINNNSTGTYQIAGDYGIAGGAASAVLDNAGLLDKSAGSGTSNIGIDVDSTGTISVASGGTLAFSGPNNVITGVLTGGGTVEFANGGTSTLTLGTISTGTVEIESATVTLGTSTTLAGSLDETAGSVLSIGANVLTLAGTASSVGQNGNAVVSGTGTLDNTGTLSVMALQLGGSATLDNTGTVDQVYNVVVGDSSGAVAHVINAAGATWNMASGYQLEAGSSTAQTFTNDGTFALSGPSGGSSSVNIAFTSAAGASIAIATGNTLTFDGIVTNAGTISGAGTMQFNYSAAGTLASGTTLASAGLDITGGASLTLGTSLAYGGVFTENADFGNTTLALGAYKLSLSGSSNSISGFEGGSTVTGSGTLVNSGTLALGELTLGSTVTLDNTAVINQTGNVAIGDGSGKTAVIDNAVGAVWNLDNTSSITNGAASTSTFENYGKFAISPGAGGVTTLNTSFVNEKSATVTITTGTLDSSGIFTNNAIISGTDFQAINSSATTLNAGTNLNNLKEFDLLDNATLTLGTNLNYSGVFDDGASFGSATINLAAHTLALKGATSISGFEGTPIITGGGTLSLTGTTQLTALTIGSTSLLSNAGTIDAAGNLQVGDSSGKAAEFLNVAKSVYDLVNDSNVTVGSSLMSDFVNNGLFEKTSGTGTSVVSSPFVNNGTITVTSGTIEFVHGTLSGGGVINGTETTDQSGDIFITHS
jgi:hypothetical protein